MQGQIFSVTSTLEAKIRYGLDDCSWLHLSAVQGLDIPYSGYFETDNEAVALGKTIPVEGHSSGKRSGKSTRPNWYEVF